MTFFDRNFKELLGSQVISLAGGLVAGTLLSFSTGKLFLFPSMLILLPGFLDLRGNISGSLAARLSSGLFLGVVDSKRVDRKIINGNLAGSFALALVVSLFLGLVAFTFEFSLTGLLIWKIIYVPVLAGILANAIEIPLTLWLTLYLFNKGHDPNNIMGPFVTSSGDVLSIVALLLVLTFL